MIITPKIQIFPQKGLVDFLEDFYWYSIKVSYNKIITNVPNY